MFWLFIDAIVEGAHQNKENIPDIGMSEIERKVVTMTEKEVVNMNETVVGTEIVTVQETGVIMNIPNTGMRGTKNILNVDQSPVALKNMTRDDPILQKGAENDQETDRGVKIKADIGEEDLILAPVPDLEIIIGLDHVPMIASSIQDLDLAQGIGGLFPTLLN